MMLHTKYQGSRPFGFRQEDCFMFLLYGPMFNTYTMGAEPFFASGTKIVSEYDQEIPQSQTADNPMAPQGSATQPSRDTRKTN